MNAAQIIDTQPTYMWTPGGDLTAAPARSANDNWSGSGLDYYGGDADVASRLAQVRLVPRMTTEQHGVNGAYSAYQARPPVIALTGPAGSGKSTVSDYLASHYGYTKTKFAKPLKDMCRALGMTESMIEGDLKEVPEPWLGDRTPRHVMQTLGTEWGRKCMGEDFWVELWENRVMLPTVIDDCRFPNEAAAVRRMGGRVIRLDGRGGIDGTHASEAGCGIADEVICNDGSIADLQARVRQVLEGWA